MIRVVLALVVLLGCREQDEKPDDGSVKPPSVMASPLLPDGLGRDVVVATCTGCHSADIIRQNQMSAADWDAIITWMQQTQNLWALAPDRRALIVDYLAEHFGTSTVSSGETPWAEPLYPPNPLW